MQYLQRFPANIWILAICQPLALATAPLLILVGGLLGSKLSPDPKLATLPLAAMIVGTALATIPAAILMKKIGRKLGNIAGLSVAMFGALSNMFAAIVANFYLLLFGSLLMGVSIAFVQQFRFAAIESVKDPSDYSVAISILMFGGVIAAILGPEAGTLGKSLIESPHGFAGSFLLAAVLSFLAIVVMCFYQNTPTLKLDHNSSGRKISEIIRQPVFIVAVSAALIGYAIMSFLMTATPISMHEHNGHSLTDTKWVIQSHIMAMFLPSLFSGLLVQQFGARVLVAAGCILYLFVLVAALAGQQVVHYWWALVLLGIGWNFMFLGGTSLLPQSYTDSEKFKVQAVNDFLVFAAQAIASLTAGWILFSLGWNLLVWICLPAILFMLILIFFAKE